MHVYDTLNGGFGCDTEDREKSGIKNEHSTSGYEVLKYKLIVHRLKKFFQRGFSTNHIQMTTWCAANT